MVAFLVILNKDLMTVSFMNMFSSYTPVAVDVAAFTVIGGLSGGVVGAVSTINNAPAAEAA